MTEDGFRERKVRPKGWMKQAIKDGTIADPETLEHPTAAEIAGALHDLNTKRGDREDAIALLSACRDHVLDTIDGRFVMVRSASDGPGEFPPPTAIVEQEQE